MQVEVSISQNRNLSSSALILRNLYVTASLSSSGTNTSSGSQQTHSSPNLSLTGVVFHDITTNPSSGLPIDELTFHIQNKQTNTLMYVRTVPLSQVWEFCRQVNGAFQNWIVLYAAGDPANQRFDPRTTCDEQDPQMYLGIKFNSLSPVLNLQSGQLQLQNTVLPGSQDAAGGAPGYLPQSGGSLSQYGGQGGVGSGVGPTRPNSQGQLTQRMLAAQAAQQQQQKNQIIAQGMSPIPPDSRGILGPDKSSIDPKAAVDADLLEVKWMANHIQRHMAQTGSQAQQLQSLNREIERLKLENTTLKSELAVEKHQGATLQEKLDMARQVAEDDQKDLKVRLNQAENDKQEVTRTMEMLRTTWQSQLNAHTQNSENCQEQLTRARRELEEVRIDLMRTRGKLEEIKRRNSSLEESERRLQDEIRQIKSNHQNNLEQTMAQIKSEADSKLQKQIQENASDIKRNFEKEKNEIISQKHELEYQCSALEAHLRTAQEQLNQMENRKIEQEHQTDAERAKTLVLEQKLRHLDGKSKNDLMEMEKTTRIKISTEINEELEKERQKLKEERRLREEHLATMGLKDEQLEKTRQRVQAMESVTTELRHKLAVKDSELAAIRQQSQNDMEKTRAELTATLTAEMSNKEKQILKEKEKLQESVEVWQKMYQEQKERVSNEVSATADEIQQKQEQIEKLKYEHQKMLDEMNSKDRKLNDIENTITSIKRDGNEKQTQWMREKALLEANITESRMKLERIEEEKTQQQNEIVSTKSEIEKLQSEIVLTKDRLRTIQEENQYNEQKLATTMKTNNDAQRDWEAERAVIREQKQELERAIADLNSDMESTKREKTNLSEELQNMRTRLTSREQELLEDLTKARQENELIRKSKEKEIDEFKNRLEEKQAESRKITEKKFQVEKDISGYQQELERLESEIKQKAVALSASKSRNEELEHQVSALQSEKHSSAEDFVQRLNESQEMILKLTAEKEEKTQKVFELETERRNILKHQMPQDMEEKFQGLLASKDQILGMKDDEILALKSDNELIKQTMADADSIITGLESDIEGLKKIIRDNNNGRSVEELAGEHLASKCARLEEKVKMINDVMYDLNGQGLGNFGVGGDSNENIISSLINNVTTPGPTTTNGEFSSSNGPNSNQNGPNTSGNLQGNQGHLPLSGQQQQQSQQVTQPQPPTGSFTLSNFQVGNQNSATKPQLQLNSALKPIGNMFPPSTGNLSSQFHQANSPGLVRLSTGGGIPFPGSGGGGGGFTTQVPSSSNMITGPSPSPPSHHHHSSGIGSGIPPRIPLSAQMITGVPPRTQGNLNNQYSSLKSTGNTKALLIGCNYPDLNNKRLNGCENDVVNLAEYLINSGKVQKRFSLRESRIIAVTTTFFDNLTDALRILRDEQRRVVPDVFTDKPTCDNIWRQIDWLIGDAQSGDNLIFYFSGYGTQYCKPDTLDSFESLLLPSDFSELLPRSFLVDPEWKTQPESRHYDYDDKGYGYRAIKLVDLASKFSNLIPSNVIVTVILDAACAYLPVVKGHVAGEYPAQYARFKDPKDIKTTSSSSIGLNHRYLPIPPFTIKESAMNSSFDVKIKEDTHSGISLLGGCMCDEACHEFKIGGSTMVEGAWTRALIRTLQQKSLNNSSTNLMPNSEFHLTSRSTLDSIIAQVQSQIGSGSEVTLKQKAFSQFLGISLPQDGFVW